MKVLHVNTSFYSTAKNSSRFERKVNRSYVLFHAAIISSFIFSFLFFIGQLIDYKNISDWSGYQYLLDTDGGWLRFFDLDVGFVFVIDISNTIFGHGNIMTLQWICYSLMSISIYTYSVHIKYENRLYPYFFITSILLFCFCAKYLAQIREGVSLAFFILGMIFIGYKKSKSYYFISILFFIVSYTMHSGISIFVFISISCVIFKDFIQKYKVKSNYMFYFAFLFGLILSYLIYENNQIIYNSITSGLGEVRTVDENQLRRVSYWSFMAVAHTYLLFSEKEINNDFGTENISLNNIVYFVGFLFIPVIISVCWLLAVLNFSDGTILASFGRLFIMGEAIFVLGLGLTGRHRLAVGLFTAALLLDQIRILGTSAAQL